MLTADNNGWISEYSNESSDFFKILDHHELFPENNAFTLIICFLYGFLFIFGLAGNLWVIVVIAGIVRNLRSTVKKKILNTILYIFVLSTVDILVLSNIPFIICDIYFNKWIFGFYVCKAYWIVESVNKLMSVYILAALSFERFMAVCKPNLYFNLRSPRASVVIICLICIIIVVVSSPIYANGRLVTFTFNMGADNVKNESVQKCVTDMDESTSVHYSFFIFGFGFGFPSLLIVFLYFRILRKLRRHFRSIRHVASQIPLKKVTCIIFLLVVIYFVCWTPFWCVSLYAVFVEEREYDDDDDDDDSLSSRVNFMYFLHLFVYLNSSINWLLYAYFNKNLKEARYATSIQKPTTDSANENTTLLINRLQINGERTLASWFTLNQAITTL